MTLKEYLGATKTPVASVATAVGVAATTVYRWVNGKRMPDANQMRAIHSITMGSVTPNDWVLGDRK